MNPDNTDPQEQDQRLPEFGQYASDQQQSPKAPSDEAPPQYGQRVPEYIPQYTSQSTPQYAQQASAPSTLPQIPPAIRRERQCLRAGTAAVLPLVRYRIR
ncbi:MAG: hypothetical protein L0K77_01085 [Bifidobacterium crudilactis]|uniref:hypothetical protein n=1 Tax=Bifidobacterium crudilactis TaxID=327277 RepID=UPI0026476FBA|nr:hypothetical protein [Bifidobacterium crudilactis]MDN6585901.1 hypothetical protein [Bifidobacterium crudilactis]